MNGWRGRAATLWPGLLGAAGTAGDRVRIPGPGQAV